MQAGGREFESLYLHWASESLPVSYLENCIYETSRIRKRKIETKRGAVEIQRTRNKPSNTKPSDSNAILSERPSKKERRVDALALRADERRDKLRKASGRSKYPMIRRYLNGGTHMRRPHVSIRQSITYGGEPGELKHLSSRRKRKKHRFPK